jgi:tRNA pseudouridine55 synthase
LNGILCIDKPSGPSSMAAIRHIKKALGVKKIGHSGTLDPRATGLLVVGIEAATRLFPYLALEPKRYSFITVFGRITDTLDDAGVIVDKGRPVPDKAAVKDVLHAFVGTIRQTPPSYSAVKIRGVRAYTLARKKCSFELPSRQVHITSLKMLRFNKKAGEAEMEVECSGGTYVRSLARDIAASCGTVGYARSIRRIRMGEFGLQHAADYDAGAQQLKKHVVPLYKALSSYPSHTASQHQLNALSHGKDIAVEAAGHSRIFIYNTEKRLVAVATRTAENTYHPVKVFAGACV